MTKDEMKRFKAQILALLDELNKTSDAAQGDTDTVQLDQSALGRVSRVDALQQQQMALENQRRRERQRRQIAGALQRIESGDFGQCYVCEEPIALERLTLNPMLTRCRTCAEDN